MRQSTVQHQNDTYNTDQQRSCACWVCVHLAEHVARTKKSLNDPLNSAVKSKQNSSLNFYLTIRSHVNDCLLPQIPRLTELSGHPSLVSVYKECLCRFSGVLNVSSIRPLVREYIVVYQCSHTIAVSNINATQQARIQFHLLCAKYFFSKIRNMLF